MLPVPHVIPNSSYFTNLLMEIIVALDKKMHTVLVKPEDPGRLIIELSVYDPRPARGSAHIQQREDCITKRDGELLAARVSYGGLIRDRSIFSEVIITTEEIESDWILSAPNYFRQAYGKPFFTDGLRMSYDLKIPRCSDKKTMRTIKCPKPCLYQP